MKGRVRHSRKEDIEESRKGGSNHSKNSRITRKIGYMHERKEGWLK